MAFYKIFVAFPLELQLHTFTAATVDLFFSEGACSTWKKSDVNANAPRAFVNINKSQAITFQVKDFSILVSEIENRSDFSSALLQLCLDIKLSSRHSFPSSFPPFEWQLMAVKWRPSVC